MTGRSFTDPQAKWFEDFELGDTMTTRGRTVDIGDITAFAGLTGDHYQLHTDAAFMEKLALRAADRAWAADLSLAVGLVGGSGFYGDAIAALVEITGSQGDQTGVCRGYAACRRRGRRARGERRANMAHWQWPIRCAIRAGDEVMTFLQTMLAKRRA